jgi:hypothetical protein
MPASLTCVWVKRFYGEVVGGLFFASEYARVVQNSTATDVASKLTRQKIVPDRAF